MSPPNYDYLTGLPNKEMFQSRPPAKSPTGRETAVLALLVLDINRFKNINDTLGHFVGDSVLRSAVCFECIGSGGLVSRIGGDFSYSAPGCPYPDEIVGQVKRVFNVSDPWMLKGIVSFKRERRISVFPEDGRDVDDSLKRGGYRDGEGKGERNQQLPILHGRV